MLNQPIPATDWVPLALVVHAEFGRLSETVTAFLAADPILGPRARRLTNRVRAEASPGAQLDSIRRGVKQLHKIARRRHPDIFRRTNHAK